MPRSSRLLCAALSLSLTVGGLPLAAHAGPIATDEIAAAPQPAAGDAPAARARVGAALAREDVQAALAARGVDAAEVAARVAALSDAEVAQLAQQIDQAPAGGDAILGTLVFIFVLLLVTDILGLTKVFPFTRSIRH